MKKRYSGRETAEPNNIASDQAHDVVLLSLWLHCPAGLAAGHKGFRPSSNMTHASLHQALRTVAKGITAILSRLSMANAHAKNLTNDFNNAPALPASPQ